jgi:hypothetical protein
MPEHMDLNTGMGLVADAIDEVAAAADPLVRAATPLIPSPGMSELSQEEHYRAKPESTPITNAYAYASLLGYGAVDALRAVATLLRAPVLPVWAPLVNARAGVEAAAQMYWLVEPGITAESRVQRGMVMRLHNARQQQRAPSEVRTAHEGAKAAVEDIASQAKATGWTISGKNQAYARVGAETLPKSRKAIDSVLRCRQPNRDTEADISWWFYSGVMHANPFAFMQFIAPDEGMRTGIAGLQLVPIYVNGRHFVTAAGTAGRATINAAIAYATLLGTDRIGIDKADRRFSETILGAFKAMDRSDARGRSVGTT